MKKLIALLLVLVMAIGLVACTQTSGGNETQGTTEATEPEVTTPVDPVAAAALGLTELSLDAQGQAKCPVCDKTVQWTEVTADSSFVVSGEQHFYLASDVTIETPAAVFTVLGEANACFALNSKTLTTAGNITLSDDNTSTGTWDDATKTNSGSQEIGVFNVLGNGGSIVYNGDSNLFKHVEGTLNLYGGTYTLDNAESDENLIKASRPLTLVDATINGAVILDSVRSTLDLKGSTTLTGKIVVAYDDRSHRAPYELCVDAGWTGFATVEVPDASIAEKVLDPTRYTATGDFTGTLMLPSAKNIVNNNGQLVVS